MITGMLSATLSWENRNRCLEDSAIKDKHGLHTVSEVQLIEKTLTQLCFMKKQRKCIFENDRQIISNICQRKMGHDNSRIIEK